MEGKRAAATPKVALEDTQEAAPNIGNIGNLTGYSLQPRQDLVHKRFTQFCNDKKGMLFIHNVGSGKTLTSLNIAFEYLLKEYDTNSTNKNLGNIVIVVPTGIFKSFQDDLNDNFSGINLTVPEPLVTRSGETLNVEKHLEYTYFGLKGNIYCILYKHLQKSDPNSSQVYTDFHKFIENAVVIFDEAHRLLRPANKSPHISLCRDFLYKFPNEYDSENKPINKFMQKCKKYILMTGTPLNNSLKDTKELITFVSGDNKFLDITEIKYGTVLGSKFATYTEFLWLVNTIIGLIINMFAGNYLQRLLILSFGTWWFYLAIVPIYFFVFTGSYLAKGRKKGGSSSSDSEVDFNKFIEFIEKIKKPSDFFDSDIAKILRKKSIGKDILKKSLSIAESNEAELEENTKIAFDLIIKVLDINEKTPIKNSLKKFWNFLDDNKEEIEHIINLYDNEKCNEYDYAGLINSLYSLNSELKIKDTFSQENIKKLSPVSMAESVSPEYGTPAKGELSPVSMAESVSPEFGTPVEGELSPVAMAESVSPEFGTPVEGELLPVRNSQQKIKHTHAKKTRKSPRQPSQDYLKKKHPLIKTKKKTTWIATGGNPAPPTLSDAFSVENLVKGIFPGLVPAIKSSLMPDKIALLINNITKIGDPLNINKFSDDIKPYISLAYSTVQSKIDNEKYKNLTNIESILNDPQNLLAKNPTNINYPKNEKIKVSFEYTKEQLYLLSTSRYVNENLKSILFAENFDSINSPKIYGNYSPDCLTYRCKYDIDDIKRRWKEEEDVIRENNLTVSEKDIKNIIKLAKKNWYLNNDNNKYTIIPAPEANKKLFKCEKFDYVLTNLIFMKSGCVYDESDKTIKEQHHFHNQLNPPKSDPIIVNNKPLQFNDATAIYGYLPIVYSTSDKLGLDIFASYLTTRGFKYILLHDAVDKNIKDEIVDEGRKPYTLNKTMVNYEEIKKKVHEDTVEPLNDEPICVLLHKEITEGVDFKYNPAIFLLEPPNSFCDFEQLCGRVLRTYPDKYGYTTKTIPTKYIYQCITYTPLGAKTQTLWQKTKAIPKILAENYAEVQKKEEQAKETGIYDYYTDPFGLHRYDFLTPPDTTGAEYDYDDFLDSLGHAGGFRGGNDTEQTWIRQITNQWLYWFVPAWSPDVIQNNMIEMQESFFRRFLEELNKETIDNKDFTGITDAAELIKCAQKKPNYETEGKIKEFCYPIPQGLDVNSHFFDVLMEYIAGYTGSAQRKDVNLEIYKFCSSEKLRKILEDLVPGRKNDKTIIHGLLLKYFPDFRTLKNARNFRFFKYQEFVQDLNRKVLEKLKQKFLEPIDRQNVPRDVNGTEITTNDVNEEIKKVLDEFIEKKRIKSDKNNLDNQKDLFIAIYLYHRNYDGYSDETIKILNTRESGQKNVKKRITKIYENPTLIYEGGNQTRKKQKLNQRKTKKRNYN
jgi:hypothetical protein